MIKGISKDNIIIDVSKEEVDKVIRYYFEGKKIEWISKHTGICKNDIVKIIRDLNEFCGLCDLEN